jgi:hypothetical protein
VSPISTASPQLCWASSPHGDLTLTGLRGWVVAAVVTTLPFAGVHIPVLLLDNQVSAGSVLIGIAGLLILGIVIRLLMGVMMRAATTVPWSIRYWMAPMPAI